MQECAPIGFLVTRALCRLLKVELTTGSQQAFRQSWERSAAPMTEPHWGAQAQHESPSTATPTTPAGEAAEYEKLDFNCLDRLLARDPDDAVGTSLSSLVCFARMGWPEGVTAELPRLRHHLLTTNIHVAHVEAVYEVATSVDALDRLKGLLADVFVLRGVHLAAARAPHLQQGAHQNLGDQWQQPGFGGRAGVQVRHPLTDLPEQGAGQGTGACSASDDDSAEEGQPSMPSSSAEQSPLVPLPAGGKAGSGGERRGRNSSPAAMLQATQLHLAPDGKGSPSPTHQGARSRAMSWLVPGSMSPGKLVSQRTLFRWRRELHAALEALDSVTPTGHTSQGVAPASKSLVRISGESPGVLASRRSSTGSETAAVVQQFGHTPASDLASKLASSSPLGGSAGSCQSCHLWSMRYQLLQSESREQIEHLKAALAARRVRVPSVLPSTPEASCDPAPVPALSAAPTGHQRKASRLGPSPDTGEDMEQCAAASLGTRLRQVSELASEEHSKWREALEEQQEIHSARERRWKRLTAKLSRRLEQQAGVVKSLSAKLKAAQA